jgi:hypothetical protein
MKCANYECPREAREARSFCTKCNRKKFVGTRRPREERIPTVLANFLRDPSLLPKRPPGMR